MQLIYYGGTLYHHGIKGQHWGTRRYQNSDGSLTPAGRERYGYDSNTKQYIKKSKTTRAFEKLANNANRKAEIQTEKYKKTKNEYNLRSSNEWKKEAKNYLKNASMSFKKDKFKATATKEEKRLQKTITKDQKKWDENYNTNWYKAYNKAAEYVNNRMSDFNKKWEKEFSGYKNWSESPKYQKYLDTYNNWFNSALKQTTNEMFGKRPKNLWEK